VQDQSPAKYRKLKPRMNADGRRLERILQLPTYGRQHTCISSMQARRHTSAGWLVECMPVSHYASRSIGERAARAMIRVGIGGWTFEPGRGPFYPAGLKHAEELGYASRHLTTIEINGTFYRTQSAASFRKWRDETPDDFVFSVKGHRAVVNARKLAEAAEPIDWFFKSGVLELGDKLGPILWQFAPFRKFNPEDLGAFLKFLPRKIGGRSLMHVVEVRHESFRVAEFVSLLREHNVAVVYADSDDYPAIADVTADFVYARLQRTTDANEAGYAAAELD